jgi:hypothetical protein
MMRLKSTYPTEIYRSDAGYICVKQVTDPGVDDQCICLSPDQAKLAAREIARLAERTVWDPIDDGGSEDTL